MRVRRRRRTSRRRRRRRPQSKQRIRGGNVPSHQSSSSSSNRGAETYQRHRTERREDRLRSSREFFPRGPERRGRRGVKNVVFLVVVISCASGGSVALLFDVVVYRSIRRDGTHIAGLLSVSALSVFERARGCKVRTIFQRDRAFAIGIF